MFTRGLLLAWLAVGAVGPLACSDPAGAAQESAPPATDEAKQDEERPGGQFCGGLAAVKCPEGLECVDDPRDSCEPSQGGADCGGVCVTAAEKGPRCDYDDPNLSYVSREPDQ